MDDGDPRSRIAPDWLDDPALQRVFEALVVEDDDARAVGGAVRNTLMQVPVTDIDIATTALPEVVMARAEAAGLKAVPTGIDHGTITVVSEHHPVEVTTLREDVATFGRKATVRFGRDWTADARRRDFTMNALYVDRHGKLYDPVDGYADCLARRVRFIGDPHQRIREDFLRILRFFRFHATYGTGSIDQAGLTAVIEEKAGLAHLSAERIGHELRRLVVAPGSAETIRIMVEGGIAELAFGKPVSAEGLVALRACARQAGTTIDPALAFVALGVESADDAKTISTHLRLANKDRDRMTAIAAAVHPCDAAPDDHAARVLLYRTDPGTYRGAILIGWSRETDSDNDALWRAALSLPDRWTAPALPLAGRDLIAAGVAPGPEISRLMKEAEDWWIESAFRPDHKAVLDFSLALTQKGTPAK
ncbi:MAG: CCA tRNA nucleotidyltransferase [Hyphomicrobiales bacterium]|nr:MAG: CCA tRNA nucleotidyltransferase [Hyphomicrobiales bacterium]